MEKIKPGTTVPAKFVGEFEVGDAQPMRHAPWDLTPEVGDVAVVNVTTEKYGRVAYLQIRCGLCGTPDTIPLQQYREGGNPSWTLASREPVNVQPSIRSTLGPNSEGRTWTCHYFVRGGRFEALPDSTDQTAKSA